MDFGSGWGTMAGLMAKKLSAQGNITCLDISEAWINASKKYLKNFSNINYIAGDITKLTIPDTSYNAIVIHFVLHDIDSSIRQSIIEKHVKILKKNGRIYIREPLLVNRGISIGYIRNLMLKNGLSENKLELTNSWLFGEMVDGVYVK